MKAAETVGFGIVGTGMVAEFHRQAIAANAEKGARLVAVCTRDPAKFTGAREKFGVPCVPWDEFCLHPDIDVACICTPSGIHARQAIDCATAGKHALVEKPIAVNLAEADAMINAFSKAGRLLGVALQRRAEPLFRKIHRALQAGDLGTLTSGVVTVPYRRTQAYYDSAAWRGTWALEGGGVLINQGIHLLDLLLWYMGDPIEIKAVAATLQQSIEVEDTLAASLRFAGGAMATIMATTVAAPGFPHRVEVYGTRGGIQLEGESVVRWTLADPTKATISPPELAVPAEAGAGADPGGIPVTGHINLVSNFIDAVHAKAPLLIDGVEGRRSLVVVLGIYAAAGIVEGAAP
jgi:UDP-N-acetyl-2-amino-2-deoxyglucuronate dehydrogenase